MNLALKDIQHNLGSFTLTTIGGGMLLMVVIGIAFFTMADAEAIQFDSSGEAVRLERSARKSRGERSELGTTQPSLVEQAATPSVDLPAIARPQISAVMLRIAPGANRQQVINTISDWGDVSVRTREEQSEYMLKGSVDKARRPLGLFRVLLTLIEPSEKHDYQPLWTLVGLVWQGKSSPSTWKHRSSPVGSPGFETPSSSFSPSRRQFGRGTA